MEEFVDLVDANGIIIKRRIARDDAIFYEDLHMQIVIVVIFNDLGQMLVHRRSEFKKVNPGDIDHVCGGIASGETPHQAAIREAQEETGITLEQLHIIDQGINPYNRYRYLLIGKATGEPCWDDIDEREVSWMGYQYSHELITKNESGELSFVDGFFDDVEKATAFARTRSLTN